MYVTTYYLFVIISRKRGKMVRILVITFVSLMWICLVCQGFSAIATRNHYTVDIWLGGLMGYMNWIWHRYVVLQKDPIIKKSDLLHKGKNYWSIKRHKDFLQKYINISCCRVYLKKIATCSVLSFYCPFVVGATRHLTWIIF